MTNGRHTAVIVGAGLGGLATAIVLRGLGFSTTLLERADQFGEVGAGIQLAPNATRVLERIGVLDAVAEKAVTPTTVDWRRWDTGKVLRIDDLSHANGDEDLTPYLHVHRADLHRVLVHAARAPETLGEPVDMRLGSEVTDITDLSTDKVRITTSSGEVLEADLVIGADGIRSKLRTLLNGELTPEYSGDAAYRALVPIHEVRDIPWIQGIVDQPRTTLWLGPRRHVVHYLVRGGEMMNIVALVNTEGEPIESWQATSTTDALVDAFHGWNQDLLTLFTAARDVTLSGIFDRPPLPVWTNGRLALIGDACHPMLPYRAQGAAQAFEDAAALGDALEGWSHRDIPRRLADYAARRQPRAAAVQQLSRDSQIMLHLDDGGAQAERDEHLAHGDDEMTEYAWLWAAAQPAGETDEK